MNSSEAKSNHLPVMHLRRIKRILVPRDFVLSYFFDSLPRKRPPLRFLTDVLATGNC